MDRGHVGQRAARIARVEAGGSRSDEGDCPVGAAAETPRVHVGETGSRKAQVGRWGDGLDGSAPALLDAPNLVVEVQNGECRWRILCSHADRLHADGVNWFDLCDNHDARLVKQNAQRDVWLMRCGGGDYFVKVYHPNGLFTKVKLLLRGAIALREWNVGRYAAAYSVSAVVPVATAWSGSRGSRGPSLLVTEAVDGAEPLNEHWLRIRDDWRASAALCRAMAQLIARAHQCGFRHGDLHPGNVLVQPGAANPRVFFVDLHKVHVGRPVGLNAVVANLAQLNQWFRRHATRTQLRRFLKYYLEYRERYAQCSPFARRLPIDPAGMIRRLAVQADRHARQLWAKRDRRLERTGRYFARIRPAPGWRGHVLLCSKHPAPTAGAARLTFTAEQWRRWLREPLSWVDPRRQELLKDSHTATVCLASLPLDEGAVKVIVKRPRARNWWKRLIQAVVPSRNLRSWRIGNMLLNRALPAAQPLAVVDRRLAGIVRLDSIGITDYVAGSVDLETFLARQVAGLEPAAQRRAKDRLIHAVIDLLRAFHARGFVHRDFKAPNLLVSWGPPYDGPPRLTLIDMDGISHVARRSEGQRERAVVRLCASLLNSPACTNTDRLRFLKQHLTGPGKTASGWKEHWRRMQRRVRAKMEDKDARRTWKLEQYGRE